MASKETGYELDDDSLIQIQCYKCKKWRYLPDDFGNDLPEQWFCEYNPDSSKNRCEVPQDESIDESNDESSDETIDESIEARANLRTWIQCIKCLAWRDLADTTKKCHCYTASTRQGARRGPDMKVTAMDNFEHNLMGDVAPQRQRPTLPVRSNFLGGTQNVEKQPSEMELEAERLGVPIQSLGGNNRTPTRGQFLSAEDEEVCEILRSSPASERARRGENTSTPLHPVQTQIKLIRDVVKLVFPLLPSNQSSTGPSTVGASTRPSPAKIPRLSEGSVKKANPIISPAWEIEKDFPAEDNRLQGSYSDVMLTVPEDAVSGQAIKIIGAVSTDLERGYRKFFMEATLNKRRQMIFSPIAEYSVEGQSSFTFRKPVTISLPHFLPPSFDQKRVTVYCFLRGPDSRLQCQKLTKVSRRPAKRKQENTQACFYFDDALKHKEVEIRTYGLAGYFLTYRSQETDLPHIALRLYTRHVQQDTPRVDVTLLISDLRLNIRDFRKETLEKQNMSYLGTMVMQPVKREGLDYNQMELELSFHHNSPSWMHKMGENGRQLYPSQQRLPLKTLYPCECGTKQVPVYWSLWSSGCVTSDVGHVSATYVIKHDRGNSIYSSESKSIPVVMLN